MRRWPPILLLVLALVLVHLSAQHERTAAYLPKKVVSTLQWSGGKPPFKPEEHHVFLATHPPWHEEVWLCLGGMLTGLGVGVTAFTECDETQGDGTCTRFGLLDLAKEIGMWGGENKLQKKESMFDAVNKPLANGKLVDTIILATERNDLEWASDRLLDLWNARPEDQKFKVVAVYHEPTGDIAEHATLWGPTGALSYMTLSPHVDKALKARLRLEASAVYQAWSGIEHIRTRTLVPWLPATDDLIYTPRLGTPPRELHTVPARACINGMISPERRAYDSTFEDMKAQFAANATLWGYKMNNDTGNYEAIDPADPNTFKLMVLGEPDTRYESLPDPGSVSAAVEYVSGYPQKEFYGYMAGVDLLLPAWNAGYRYIESQASSTAFTSLETEVPVLTTPIVVDAYSFLDDSVAVIRPNALTEIDAIGLFRQFPNSHRMSLKELEDAVKPLYPPPYNYRFPGQVARMLKGGWKRDRNGWNRKKRSLERGNEDVLRDLLVTPLGE